MQWLKNLFGSRQSVNLSESTANRPGATLGIAEAWKKHGAELQSHLNPEIKKRVFVTWREYVDREMHYYADLVASHPTKSEQIAKLEADTIMETYLCGYMAKRGWIEEMEALQMPYMLGRRLRDGIRTLGVPMTNVSANLGTDMTKALQAVLKLGME